MRPQVADRVDQGVREIPGGSRFGALTANDSHAVCPPAFEPLLATRAEYIFFCQALRCLMTIHRGMGRLPS
jgi:hypothetical protein